MLSKIVSSNPDRGTETHQYCIVTSWPFQHVEILLLNATCISDEVMHPCIV